MTRLVIFSGLLFVGVLCGASERGTVAALTTSTASLGNAFTAGTLHISDTVAAGTTLSMDNLIGGDNLDAEIDVANTGSLSLLYSMTSSVTGSSALASTLQLTVRAKTTNACASRDGTVLYTGAVSAAAIGDPTHGLQPGDRTLSGGASEALCFTIELPSTVTASVAASSATATFTFSAEQS